MRLAVGSLLVLAVAGCASSHPPAPPPNSGTLIVSALGTVGPRFSGSPLSAPAEGAITRTKIVVAASNGHTYTARTDTSGNAIFHLPPGEYTARLADEGGCDAGAGRDTVHVTAHQTVKAQVTCAQP